MKRSLVSVVLLLACLIITGCQRETVQTQPTQAQTQPSQTEAADPEWNLIGPWHLADGKNNPAVLLEQFGTSMHLGASMEVTSKGNLSWYIGATGATGTYTREGNLLRASLTHDTEGTPIDMTFTAFQEDGVVLLAMDYEGQTVYWSQEEEMVETEPAD